MEIKTRAYKKAEWLINTKNKLQGIKEGPETDIHLESLKGNPPKSENWKAPDRHGIRNFWFKRFTLVYDGRAEQLHKSPSEANISK